jgi:hypothetical protein
MDKLYFLKGETNLTGVDNQIIGDKKLLYKLIYHFHYNLDEINQMYYNIISQESVVYYENKRIENIELKDLQNVNCSIVLTNGLGDKLLDLIGFCIICKYLNYNPNVIFHTSHWGNYDMRLFDFTIPFTIPILNKNTPFYITSPNPSVSLSPYKVWEYINQFIEVSFKTISNDFIVYSKKIQPSQIILNNIPNGIENAYGIHLRKSDKINKTKLLDKTSTTFTEFDIITNKLLEDVKHILNHEKNAIFLIVSEDKTWREDFKHRMNELTTIPSILEINYTHNNEYENYNSVLDMFCLSKCKDILQCTKYSTFSMVASLLGNGKLRNYSEDSLCYIWNCVIEINGTKTNDIEPYKKLVTNNIKTNITFKQHYSTAEYMDYS